LSDFGVLRTALMCCDDEGVAAFQLLRHRRNKPRALLYAFDLLELNGADLRRGPVEVRKANAAEPKCWIAAGATMHSPPSAGSCLDSRTRRPEPNGLLFEGDRVA
jgi:hypothetical protein